jgi:hypothetical protein
MVTTHKRKRTMDQEKARRRINIIQRVMTATDSTTTLTTVSTLN